MQRKLLFAVSLIGALIGAHRAASAADSADPAPWFVYGVIIFILFSTIVALLIIRAAVAHSRWSLADALSEETEVTSTFVNANGQTEPRLDAAGQPLMVKEMRASISRLIALMGMMAILLMFVGFGVFALYRFAVSGIVSDDIDKVINFLAAGMTLFAPYLVNKFSSLFEGLAPKR